MRDEECIADYGSAMLMAAEGKHVDARTFYSFCKGDEKDMAAAKAAVERILPNPPACVWQ